MGEYVDKKVTTGSDPGDVIYNLLFYTSLNGVGSISLQCATNLNARVGWYENVRIAHDKEILLKKNTLRTTPGIDKLARFVTKSNFNHSKPNGPV